MRRWIKFLGLQFVWIVMFVLALITGPDEIEAWVAPIAGPTVGKVTSDDGKDICWTISFEKLRDATPVVFSWALVTDNGDRYTLGAYQRSTGEAYRTNNTSPKGVNATYDICADRPAGVREQYRLTAYGRYKVWHGMWTVPRTIQPFR